MTLLYNKFPYVLANYEGDYRRIEVELSYDDLVYIDEYVKNYYMGNAAIPMYRIDSKEVNRGMTLISEYRKLKPMLDELFADWRGYPSYEWMVVNHGYFDYSDTLLKAIYDHMNILPIKIYDK